MPQASPEVRTLAVLRETPSDPEYRQERWCDRTLGLDLCSRRRGGLRRNLGTEHLVR